MKNTIIDAGPLIALFNKRDKHHAKIIDFLRQYTGTLTTSWPVITEVTHMLSFHVQAQLDFLTWIQRGGLSIEELSSLELDRIITMTEKYQNVPMDLADASLVAIAEKLHVHEIITIDSDYYIYRTAKNSMLKNVFQ